MENILFFSVLAVLILTIIMYNGIINSKNSVSESFSSIDTVLQNRYNLIPNLIEVVKQYMNHEAAVLDNVSKMRSQLISSGNQKSSERFEIENEIGNALKSIFSISENYPDLKSSANFIELQNQWSEIEDRLQGARRAYNYSVKELKNKQEMFPSNIIASMMKIPEYKMFEAEEYAKIENINAKNIFNS